MPDEQPKIPARTISAYEHTRMIDEAAYYLAEKRGFLVDPKDNWIAAEKEVNARLAAENVLVK